MKSKYQKYALCPFLIIMISSCQVKKFINKKFPPLTTIDQQINSINQNLKFIDSIEPSIGVHIGSDMLIEYLPSEIKKLAETSSDENLVIEKLEPEISFEKQGLILKSSFSISIPEHHVKLEGNLIGLTAVSSATDSLYLLSAFKSLNITDIEFTKRPGLKKRAIAKLLVPILRKYIANINGILLKEPSVMDIGWNGLISFNPKEMFKGKGTEVTGPITDVFRYLDKNSILIDSNGISIIIELTDEEPIPVENTIEVSNNYSRNELNKKFKLFKGKYDRRWNEVFEEQVNDTISIALVIAKAELAKIFNEGFAKGFSLKQKIEIPKTSFNSKVEVKQSKINCEKVRTKFSFPAFRGESCNWSCGDLDPVCHSTRAACRVRREAARIVWQGARETARIAHQGENETKVAACKVWKETNNFLNLGRFKGGTSGGGTGTMSFSRFEFNEDLSELSFNNSGKVNLSINSSLRLRPQDLGYVFLCNSNYDRSLQSKASAIFPKQQGKIALKTRKISDNLALMAEIEPLSYSAKLFPSPLHVYLIDPAMIVQCPVFRSILGLGTGAGLAAFLAGVDLGNEAELILLGSTKGKYEVESSKTIFEPVLFSIDNQENLKSNIYWKNKFIEFSYARN